MEEKISLSPEAQQTLLQIQTFQQQLQNTLIQKETLNLQKLEIEKALEELEKIDEKKDVFKVVGPILVKSDKKDVEKDLKEKLETINLRLKTLDKHEEKLKEKIKEKQEKLQHILRNLGAGK
jgi:prefoldin beta subunit